MTYLAVPIAAKDFKEALRQIRVAVSRGAELLELRTDYLESLNVELAEKLIAAAKAESEKPLPVIVTCRSKSQGGSIAYPDKLRLDILTTAIKTNVEFIDFEYESFRDINNQEKIRLALSQARRTRLILSAHNFKGPFDDAGSMYRHILATYPAAIPKLVYTANHINDCFDALDLLSRTHDKAIIFCMGRAGLITRILAKKLGSFLTFAASERQTATAPGQLTIEELKDIYRYDSIDEDTQLFGVIGSPLEHSLSPLVHNACFAAADLNCLYLPLLLQGGRDEFYDFMYCVIGRRWLGFKGFSITIPHKQNALDFVAQRQGYIEPLAEIIGAANTLLLGPDDKTKIYNTDYKGATDAIIAAGIKRLRGIDTAVIGAGGVARAVVAGLTTAGANVVIYNRTVKKAQRLAAEFNCRFAPLDELKNLSARLLVNCTSLGMYPNVDTTPVPSEYLTKGMAVFDTVYNPPLTKLLKDAKRHRAKTISGLDMFINQAAAQFKLFTGRDPDIQTIRDALSDCLPNR
jgi:3-dehydroquinate dehydratase/shikimate dehydrogenase